MKIVFAWPPKELNPNFRGHWAVKARAAKEYRATCGWTAKCAAVVVKWDGPIHLWIKFVPPDRRRRDDDNCLSSFKAGRDGLADALGVNDRRFVVHPLLADAAVFRGAIEVVITSGSEAP